MKAWTIIQNDKQYEEVMDRIDALSANPPVLESEKGKELYLLGYLADKYESEKFPISHPDPVKAIMVRMGELGLTVADLKAAFGDRGTASKVLNRKRPLSLNMVRRLSEQLSLPPALLMMPIRLATARQSKSLRLRSNKGQHKPARTASKPKRRMAKGV